MLKQIVKIVPYDVCEHLPNLTGCPLSYHKTYVSFVIPIYVTAYAERQTKIGLVVADK